MFVSNGQVIGNSISFAMGSATTLILLGLAASFAGKAYSNVGQGLPMAASFLAVVMGLNLLEVINNTIIGSSTLKYWVVCYGDTKSGVT